LVIDTETGGIDPGKHSLLEVALAVYDPVGDNILESDSWMVKEDEYVVTPEAIQVNKISLLSLHKHGSPPEEVIQKIEQMVERNFEDKPVVVGHNVNFDINFVDCMFNRFGQSFKDLISHRTLDTAGIIRFFQLTGKIPPTVSGLKGALAYFGIRNTQIHRAHDDCIDTAKLLSHLIYCEVFNEWDVIGQS